MIWQSWYWKKELLEIADKLEKRINQKKWFDSSNAYAEMEIMTSAFMLRKLFESKKIDNAIQEKQLKIIQYKSNGQKIHVLKRLSPERFFDMEKPIKSVMTVKNLYNNIIHSYIFLLYFIDREFKYFWVASDLNKFRYMFQIEVKDYISILRDVGNFRSYSEIYRYDEKKEDYDIIFQPKEQLHIVNLPLTLPKKNRKKE